MRKLLEQLKKFPPQVFEEGPSPVTLIINEHESTFFWINNGSPVYLKAGSDFQCERFQISEEGQVLVGHRIKIPLTTDNIVITREYHIQWKDWDHTRPAHEVFEELWKT